MIYHTRTRIFKSLERQIAAAAGTLVEGMVLISRSEAGVGKVLASNGDSNDIFGGIALNYFTRPTTAVFVDTITIPATSPYTVTLSYTPLNPTTGVSAVDATSLTAQTYNAAVGSGQFSISGAVLTANSAQAGAVWVVTYQRALTADEALMIQGDSVTLGAVGSSDRTKSIGALLSGEIWTDSIDPAANWQSANITDIKTGVGGVLTRGGSGAAIPAQVLAAPTATVPYLGILLNS